jgi:NitT/TauT family transport system ATP-binding protein
MDHNQTPSEELLRVDGVRKAFIKPDGSELLVLDRVDLSIKRREIVGLLGRSGSGKSTLLRTIAGLVQPSGGTLLFKGAVLDRPAAGIAMVFQSFALFPWLSVLDNVELGLEGLRGTSRDDVRERSLNAIELIGLSGFESAYPKELSGGMRQRVGFARALVVKPDILLMDEPFSALDVLTAETLRTDFLELWKADQAPVEAVLIVTHNIEEAVLMCDRVLVFSSNPGRIAAEIPIPLPHPRDRHDPNFIQLVEDIYVLMTARAKTSSSGVKQAAIGIGERLPRAGSNEMAGLLEALEGEYEGHADLPELAQALRLEIDELFPIVEALQLLRFASAARGDMRLSAAGRRYVEGDTQVRKRLFAEHLLREVPLVAHIRRVLDERPNHQAPWLRFVTELEDHLSESEAEIVLQTAIEWARYGEVFSYDDGNGILSIEEDAA